METKEPFQPKPVTIALALTNTVSLPGMKPVWAVCEEMNEPGEETLRTAAA